MTSLGFDRRLTDLEHPARAGPPGRELTSPGAACLLALSPHYAARGAAMTDDPNKGLPAAKRKRLIFWAVLRGVATTTALVVFTMCCRWTSRGIPAPRCAC